MWELLKSQKEDLFTLTTDLGMDPTMLVWDTWRPMARSQTCLRVSVRDTSFYFSFDGGLGVKSLRYSPGAESVSEISLGEPWSEVRHRYALWLDHVMREMRAGDPWGEMRRQSVSFDLKIDDGTPDQPFSVEEHRKVIQALGVIQALLITYAKEINQKQDAIIDGISKLAKGAESQERKSWFQQAVGYILSTATAMGLDSEKTKALFVALRDGLKGVVLLQ